MRSLLELIIQGLAPYFVTCMYLHSISSAGDYSLDSLDEAA
jgi:hypothetical protein